MSQMQELLPHVQWLFHERDKQLKRKIIAELPRRMSDRIALKAQREEQVCHLLNGQRDISLSPSLPPPPPYLPPSPLGEVGCSTEGAAERDAAPRERGGVEEEGG